MTQATEGVPLPSFVPTPPAMLPQEEFETASVDFDTVVPVGTTELTPTPLAPGVFSRYAPQPRESHQLNLPVGDPTDVSTLFPHAQTGHTSRAVMMAHPTSNAPARTASPPNDDFERKREMLRAIGAVASPSEQRRRRPPPSAQGEPSFTTPQATAAFSTARQSRLSAATSGVSPRNRRSRSFVSPWRPAGEDMAANSPWSAAPSLSVTREENAFLRKKGTQFGFRYEEVLELYRLAKGDLGLTVKNLQNLHEAARVILEDEAEAEAKAEDMREVVDSKEDDVNLAVNTVGARGSDGIDSGDDARREEIDEEEEEILNSDLPPPNSMAKAYQLRQRRLSGRRL